ncbi:hypothetical protein [Flagellimonas sp.]|uniref:hypothetical protein n=1 Tax=Flagellimonas sp. TaxID=2058762 RepID=UPI003F49BF18
MEIVDSPENMRKRAEKNGYRNGTKYNGLASQLVHDPKWKDILPTPRCATNNGIGYPEMSEKKRLEDVIAKKMLPTPTTRDYKGARTKESLKDAGRNEKNSLPDAFSQNGKSSQLNPRFVAEMMGFPPNWTELPFLNGETNPSKDMETQ